MSVEETLIAFNALDHRFYIADWFCNCVQISVHVLAEDMSLCFESGDRRLVLRYNGVEVLSVFTYTHMSRPLAEYCEYIDLDRSIGASDDETTPRRLFAYQLLVSDDQFVLNACESEAPEAREDVCQIERVARRSERRNVLEVAIGLVALDLPVLQVLLIAGFCPTRYNTMPTPLHEAWKIAQQVKHFC